MIKNKNKVAIVSTSLGSGGAERFAALLSVMLEKLDFEVHSIIINDNVDYQYSGELFNLGKLCNNSFFFFKKFKKGFFLNRYLKKNKIAFIIDNRTRNNLIRELITKQIYGKAKIYYVVQNYKFEKYFPSSVFWSKILYENAEKLICVSQEIEEKIKQNFDLKNTITIHNSFDISTIELKNKVSNSEKYILFFGRFDEKAKNFSLMLEAFLMSKIFLNGYHLRLMGDGADLLFIQKKIEILQLQSFVKILPFKSDPFEELQFAKFTILTSHYEGFPLSIIESLAIGTPVIAVDCHSGPREVIKHGYNGLLIENNNPQAFAEAMNLFIDDIVLYDFCKKNAAKSVEHLSLETISKQWESILC
jgi:glycosyltransferase involved in cell wall biosynthesis